MKTPPPNQLNLFDASDFQQHERARVADYSLDNAGYDPTWDEPKSSPVPRDSVQRENFQWVEEYLVRSRFIYYRWCCLTGSNIKQVVKIHIPGAGRSVREERAALVKEAIAQGFSPEAIVQLICKWREA